MKTAGSNGIVLRRICEAVQITEQIKRPDGSEITSGFDGTVSIRRDADLQYPLHQTDYFKNLDLAGVTDFEAGAATGCTATALGKGNNQFYDVETGCSPVLVSIEQFVGGRRDDPGVSRLQELRRAAGGDHTRTMVFPAAS